MIRRTCRRAESLHLGDKERHQSLRIQDGLCLLVKICLVGGTAAFCHTKESVFHAFGCLDIYLGRQVALGVDLLIH